MTTSLGRGVPSLRYRLREAAISAAINAVLSAVFVWLMFGHQAWIPTRGPRSLLVDALPQSFMISLMATAMPTLITRKRFGLPADPARCAAVSVVVAVTAAIICGALHWLFLPSATWSLRTVLAAKTIYGAALGATVTTVALRHPFGGQSTDRSR